MGGRLNNSQRPLPRRILETLISLSLMHPQLNQARQIIGEGRWCQERERRVSSRDVITLMFSHSRMAKRLGRNKRAVTVRFRPGANAIDLKVSLKGKKFGEEVEFGLWRYTQPMFVYIWLIRPTKKKKISFSYQRIAKIKDGFGADFRNLVFNNYFMFCSFQDLKIRHMIDACIFF